MLEILTYPNQFLQQPTKPVENIDGMIQKFIDDMAATMYAAPGVGLAAIQVGFDKSILVYDIAPPEDGRSLQVLINPRIISKRGEVLSENEGCLSVPEYRADVKRATEIVVEGLDREGNVITIEAEGFPAIVLQHEIDHLNGTLFIDHLSALKRELYKRRVLKQLKRE
ncbi:MAG: peptide deformylase [Desulfobacterales bacterium]|nr:peptide deformylase [Desulfobacterales bacterium]